MHHTADIFFDGSRRTKCLKQIVQNCVQESQKIFKAEYPMENVEATKTKLIGYGFQLLEGEP